MRLLYRPREDADPFVLIDLSTKIDLLLGPALPYHLCPFSQAADALLVTNPKGGELARRPPTDAEFQPSAGEHVHHRVRFGGQQRVVEEEHHDGNPQPDTPGAARDGRE